MKNRTDKLVAEELRDLPIHAESSQTASILSRDILDIADELDPPPDSLMWWGDCPENAWKVGGPKDRNVVYSLTEGVTAIWEGLVFSDEWLFCFIAEIGSDEEFLQAEKIYDGMFTNPIMPWPEAFERLRYKEGKPWCQLMNGQVYSAGGQYDPFSDLPTLDRVAALLCDDSESFKLLHWCVLNLGNKK